MITSDGKEIISKYLLGQVPAYATHLSIGCGATPLDANDIAPSDLYAKQRMDFEMTRVPISSKGFVDNSETYSITYKELVSNVATLTTSVAHNIVAGETIIVSWVDDTFNGQFRVVSVPTSTTLTYSLVRPFDVTPATLVDPSGTLIVSRTKMSLTAELPTDNRYDITEVGIWSAGSNSLATLYDSRMIFNFAQSWQIHGNSISDPPLNSNLGFNGVSTDSDIHDNGYSVIYANTNDAVFQVSTRKDRKEGPRHLNRTLLVRGDLSTILPPGGGAWDTPEKLEGEWVVDSATPHIHLNNVSFDISGNSTSDLLKLAYSLVDQTSIALGDVNDVKIVMEFFRNEVTTTTGYAKAQIYVPGSYFSTNRYRVTSWELSQDIDYSNEDASYSLPYTRFYTSSDFSSSEVRVCRIWVDVTEDAEPDGSHYIAFDGFRLENTTENPTYKMSGYSIVRSDGTPITKAANTNNYIDFRFSLGVS